MTPAAPSGRFRDMARRAVVAGGFVVLALGVLPTATAQDVSNTYFANIDASGVQIRVAGQGLPAAQLIEASPWAALGRIDNTQALGQAGVPYLGDFVTPLIGTVNGLGGGGTNLPPLPTLPGYVSSAFPNDPSASQENVGFLISSKSEDRSVTSHVQVGAPPVATEGNSTIFANAHADFDAASGVLTATGDSGVEALNLGGVVRIGTVSSSVRVVDDGEHEPTLEYSTDIAAASVLGIPIGIDKNGVAVLGTNVPVLEPTQRLVNEALKALGVSVRVVPAETVVSRETGRVESVTTAALEIGLAVEVPVIGLTEVRLTIGRVFVQFLNRPFAGRPASESGQPTMAPATPSTGAPSTGAPFSLPPSGSVGVPGSGSTPAPATSAGPIRVVSGLPDSMSFRGLYLILVLAGIAMAGPATLLERAGFVARRIWR